MKMLKSAALLAFVPCLLFCYATAQTSADSSCHLDAPTFATTAPNIFNDRQEQDLGDAVAEYYEARLHLAAPEADDQLTRIGEKLLATLPPTGIQFHFRMYNSGIINGFSTAGGRVYIARKLVIAVQNEDELAGVIAHEIGHIRNHQPAIEFTRLFRIRLGITQVTDRADIFAKVHQLFSTPPKPNEEDGHDEKGELNADHVALYAMVRAGYSAEAFPTFFNLISLNKGKKGDWLSDVFGVTHEAARRYRASLDQISQLPAGCKGRQPGESPEFQAWLHAIIEERAKSEADYIEGDRPVKLDPPLNPSLWRIRFSPDGRLILAQDDSSIFVLDKDAGKALFRIDAPGVEGAQFSPDSKRIVFHDAQLRVEQWSLETGKRISAKELVVYEHCAQTLLTPDAKTFVCAYSSIHGDNVRVGLQLIDVESGKAFFDKPDFFEPGAYTSYALRLRFAYVGAQESGLMNMLATPDSKYLLLAAGNRVQVWDLETRQQLPLQGLLQKVSQSRMSFMGTDQLVAVDKLKPDGMYDAWVMSFPAGQLLKETEIGNQQFESVSKGEMVIIHPLKDYPVGIFDPVQGKVASAAKFPAIDAWETSIALEDALGGVSVAQMGAAGSKHIPLPLGPLPPPKAAAFSADGKYLAVSVENRAMIWGLETGKQVKIVRPFRSAWFDGQDRLFGQFPKFIDKDPAEFRISMDPPETKNLAKFEDRDQQYRDLELSSKPMGKSAETVNHSSVELERMGDFIVFHPRGSYSTRHATLEFKKMESQAAAWSRDYPDETPTWWPAEDNRVVFAWDMSDSTAKSEIKNSPELQKEAEAAKSQKKGLLIETVVPETGVPLEKVILPGVGLRYGLKEVSKATVSGKFVLARGEHDNTAIFRLQDGAKVGEFFGTAFATDAADDLIAAVNREDEVILMEESTGQELDRFSFGWPVRLAQFLPGKQATLLVLTADQVVHRIPLGDAAKAEVAGSN